LQVKKITFWSILKISIDSKNKRKRGNKTSVPNTCSGYRAEICFVMIDHDINDYVDVGLFPEVITKKLRYLGKFLT
jgi:hypothetical protein